MDEKFEEAVNRHEIIEVRISLKNEILLDKTGVSFSEMQCFAEQNLYDLYQEHDGEVFEEVYKNLTEDSLADISNKLYYNFSKERLDFYVKAVKSVYGNNTAEPTIEPTDEAENETKSETHNTAEDLTDKNAVSGTMLFCGGVVLASGIAGRTILPIVLGSALITVGVAKIVKDNLLKK